MEHDFITEVLKPTRNDLTGDPGEPVPSDSHVNSIHTTPTMTTQTENAASNSIDTSPSVTAQTGDIIFETTSDRSTAVFKFSTIQDYRAGYELALVDAVIPNSAQIEIPSEPLKLMWYMKKSDPRWNLSEWVVDKARTAKREYTVVEETDEHKVVIEHLSLPPDFVGGISLPAYVTHSVERTISFINNYIQGYAWKGRTDVKAPSLLYSRGFVHIVPGSPWEGHDRSVFMVPIFGPETSKILGTYTEFQHIDLKRNMRLYSMHNVDTIVSTDFADTHKNIYFHEIDCDAILPTIPGGVHHDRILTFIPLQKSHVGEPLHYKFKPIYYPMSPEKRSSISIDIRKSNGSFAKFNFGGSYFRINIRKKQ